MGSKKFLSYPQQIDLLLEKGLIISDREFAVALLKRYSYFNLINGYKEPFKKKDGTYKTNTKFEDIYYLYQYDDQLRHILMKYLLIVELHIKSLLSYSFCETFGELQSEYQNATNYNYSNPEFQQPINDLIQKLNIKLKESDSISYIKHQYDCHKNVPLWVLVKAFTFGNISKMYSFQQPQIQSKICHEFYGIRENDLGIMLDVLTRYRNVCAHNERLFDFKYRKKQIHTTVLHVFFGLDRKRSKGTNLFDVIISLKFLLPKEQFENMVDEIDICIETLFKRTNQIQKSHLFKMMGFPQMWKEIRNIGIKQLKIVQSKPIALLP